MTLYSLGLNSGQLSSISRTMIIKSAVVESGGLPKTKKPGETQHLIIKFGGGKLVGTAEDCERNSRDSDCKSSGFHYSS